ncbi:MAG: nuclear transport factor 2 family protein [Pseudonocardia sp.]|nr:nuclear transport factor 2 family protein [Pseudonocardia sp.]
MTDDDVLDLVHRWASAEQDNDPDRLDRLLAEAFVGVGAAGFVLTRTQWLERFGNGLRNERFTIEQPQVHRYGTSAAVVVGVDAQQTTMGERDVSGRFRVTLTAVRPGDEWLLGAVHIGALQRAPGGER